MLRQAYLQAFDFRTGDLAAYRLVNLGTVAGPLDRALADLLAHVDGEVGLDRTLPVLSTDRGGPDNLGHLAQFGIGGGIIDV